MRKRKHNAIPAVSAASFRSLLDRILAGLIQCGRPLLALVLRAVSLCGASAAEWGAAQTRRLPRRVWATKPHLTVRRLGLRFELDLRDNVQRTLYFTGWYERRYLTLIRSSLRRRDVYVDVGAHIGIHAQLIANDLLGVGGRVVAFEPSPDIAAALRRMSVANGLTNLDVVAVALGAEHGRAELHSDPVRFDKADAAVRSFYAPGETTCAVDVMPYDEWVRSHGSPGMSLVKIDVEGAELAVLKGMAQSIGVFRPRIIGVEIRDYLLAQGGTSEIQLRSFLDALGYSPVDTADLEGNYIFAPRGML